MKKFLSIALAVVMIAAMAITVSAGGFTADDVKPVAFGIKKANTAWKADGVLSDGEYYVVNVDKSWVLWECASEDWYDAAKNLDFTLAMSWDDANIYTFIQFTDPDGEHVNDCAGDPASMWQFGCVQVSMSGADEAGDQRLEYGVAKTGDGQLIDNVWADYLSTGYAPSGDYTVVVDGAKITYEVRTPMSAFLEKAVGEGEKFGANFVISWGNSSDHCHTSIAAGCTGATGKAADLFAKVTLEAAPAAAEAPAAAADVVVAPAAQTADLAVVAIIALGAVAVAKKH